MAIWRDRNWRSGLLGVFGIIGVLAHVIFCCENRALAQITPDGTLGDNSSTITPNVNIKGLPADRIDGGATRGANLFHSFREFNVGELQRVYFANPTGIENILTRVTGSNISKILGTLGVDGAANLFLLNPNGILFGKNATLDIRGSFTATTANSILLGKEGLFSATAPQSSNLLSVKPEALFTNALVNHQAAIKNEANLVVDRAQVLTLYGGNVTSNGSLIAPGGTVQVLGKQVGLLDNARIDVSSPTGGGTVLIGGGFQGKGKIPNSTRTYISPQASINADALNSGNGGTVIVWADEVAGFHGNISARGGSIIGNGGFVEISSKEHLIFRGNVDTSAVNGLPGTLLLDPTNIAIASGSGDEAGDGTDKFAGNNSSIIGSILSTPLGEINDTVPITIYESELEGLSGDTNIILQATNNITVKDLVDDSLNLTAGKGVIALSADADNNGVGDFVMEDTVADTIKTNGRDITISGVNVLLGNIDTSFNIPGDAGKFIGEALVISNQPGVNLESISGNLTDATDVDLFQIFLTGEKTFSATAVDGTNVDTQLFLFDANGKGIYGNDDQAECNCTQSTLPKDNTSTPTSPGIYYLAITSWDNEPFSVRGAIFPIDVDIAAQVNGSTGAGGNFPLSNWINLNGGSSGLYTISLTGVEAALTTSAETSFVNTNSGSINLNATNGNLRVHNLNATATGKGGEIRLTATRQIDINTIVDASGSVGNGGEISLFAGENININSGSLIQSNGLLSGSITLKSDADIIARESIINSEIFSALPNITGGDINLISNSVIFRNGARVSARTFGEGNIGKVVINATDVISFDGQDSQGLPGGVFSDVQLGATGSSGLVKIATGSLFLTNGARIDTSTLGEGNAGKVIINATDTVSFDGEDSFGFPSGTGSGVAPNAKGDGGDIEINTKSFYLTNGSVVFTSTLGEGNAGRVIINASESVSFDGEDSQGLGSGIFSQVNENAKGDAGSIEISTGTLTFTNGGKITSNTSGEGNAGSVIINASDSVIFNGESSQGDKSGTFSQVESQAIGEAGDIDITTDSMFLINGAGVSVSSEGAGKGGDIQLQANSLTLDNQGFISAETASAQGGNITLTIPELLILRDRSFISATAGLDQASGTGDGGNITITTPFIVAVPQENSDITANASKGNGGRVNITAQGIFGTQPRPRLTALSDITASSEFGIQGFVTINTPDVDPTRGLVQLPSNLVDASQQITSGCTPGGRQTASRFIATGRGGLPLSPNEPLRGRTMLTDWVDLPPQATHTVTDKLSPASVTKPTNQIVEAQGWIVDANGDVILVSQSPQSSSIPSAISCSQ